MTETDIQRYAREIAAVDLTTFDLSHPTTAEYRLAHEVVRLLDAVATVSGERDALAAVVEVLRQYYQRKANDDELYAAFCAWRENPFTGKASA